MNNTSESSAGNSAGNTSTASTVDDCAQVIQESWQRRAASVKDHGAGQRLALSEMFEFREIVYGSADYKTTLALRHQILREPLGLNLWHENLSVEIDQRHFTLWQRTGSLGGCGDNTAELLACVVIVPKSPGRVKLRQMAVNTRHQRRGLGQRLIAAVEDILLNQGVRHIELSARETAIAFYQACGYEREGPAYIEIGLPHQRMIKTLQPRVKQTNVREQL